MECPRCRQDNPPQAKFCLKCGAGVTLTCLKCNTELPAGAGFCFACGESLLCTKENLPRPFPGSSAAFNCAR